MKLREEFAALSAQVDATLKQEKITAADKVANANRLARMAEIKNEQAAIKAYAAMKLAAGEIENVEEVPVNLRTGQAGHFASFDRCPILFGKAGSIAQSMGMQRHSNSVGFGSLIRSIVAGPRSDTERFEVANSTDGTGVISLDAMKSALLLDAMRGSSAAVAAGVGILPFTTQSRLAVLSTEPATGWRAENGAVSVTESFTGLQLVPKSVTATVKISRELMQDALNPAEFEASVARAIARAVDAAVFNGAGGNAPTGVSAVAGNAVVAATNGDQLSDYSKFTSAMYQVQSAGYSPTAVVLSPREIMALSNLTDSTDQPLRPPVSIAAIPFIPVADAPITQTQGSSTDASTMLLGDFSKVIVAVRSPLTFELLREAYADNFQYGLIAHLRMDVGVAVPGAISKITGIIP